MANPTRQYGQMKPSASFDISPLAHSCRSVLGCFSWRNSQCVREVDYRASDKMIFGSWQFLRASQRTGDDLLFTNQCSRCGDPKQKFCCALISHVIAINWHKPLPRHRTCTCATAHEEVNIWTHLIIIIHTVKPLVRQTICIIIVSLDIKYTLCCCLRCFSLAFSTAAIFRLQMGDE